MGQARPAVGRPRTGPQVENEGPRRFPFGSICPRGSLSGHGGGTTRLGSDHADPGPGGPTCPVWGRTGASSTVSGLSGAARHRLGVAGACSIFLCMLRPTSPDVSPAARKVMQGNKARDTKPEMIVRRLLHGMGYRYRLHRRDLPRTPDIVFGPHREIVLVHGCFWHGHDCRAASKARDAPSLLGGQDRRQSTARRPGRGGAEVLGLEPVRRV